MPSFNNFRVTQEDPAQIDVPTFRIEGQLVTDDQKTIIADFTGQNAKMWPYVLGLLSPETQQAIVNEHAQDILRELAGI